MRVYSVIDGREIQIKTRRIIEIFVEVFRERQFYSFIQLKSLLFDWRYHFFYKLTVTATVNRKKTTDTSLNYLAKKYIVKYPG